MTDTITITGVVATDPNARTVTGNLPVTNFRLAATPRRYDKSQARWIDGETNWYSVSTFRQLALNTAASVHKGERVIVTGRVRIKNWQTGEKNGTDVDIQAEALGHDLSWGTSQWERVSQSKSIGSSEHDASSPPDPADPADPAYPSTANAASDWGSRPGVDPDGREGDDAMLASAGAEVPTPY